MRTIFAAICLVALAHVGIVAEANENFTVVLHARTPGRSGSCTETGLPDCVNTYPITTVTPNTEFRLYIFIYNHVEVEAFQTAFQWPADWICDPDGELPTFLGCRMHQNQAHEPQGKGGPLHGTLATAFDCFSSPAICAIGRIDFLSGEAGCLTQINPVQGLQRIEILDCQLRSTLFDADTAEGQMRLGSICVGAPGRDACYPLATPVEGATWGRIKASYR